ncbi:hypothetical protein EV06_0347 [Prochlorococcus sp. MIT 0602]|nr:hypothetical protein EV06_0347 [Prochlorococcus sp. MIT 0602]KGG17018.1 hypothetical protein EV07_0446 [Prochlorococcus sp. MIT 0603]
MIDGELVLTLERIMLWGEKLEVGFIFLAMRMTLIELQN